MKIRLSVCNLHSGPIATAMSCTPTSAAPAIIIPLTPIHGRNRDTVMV